MRALPRFSGRGRVPQKDEGVVIGGPTVNTQAQQAEQQNQNTAQQYAAQQQQQALAGINNWTAQNKAPVTTAAPLQAPTAASPATMGGGNVSTAPAGRPMQPPQAQKPPAAPAPAGITPGAPVGGAVATAGQQISPQLRAQIMAALGGPGAR